MLIQIAVLAVLFLGERLGAMQVLGPGLAGGGVLFVQLARRRPAGARPAVTDQMPPERRKRFRAE